MFSQPYEKIHLRMYRKKNVFIYQIHHHRTSNISEKFQESFIITSLWIIGSLVRVAAAWWWRFVGWSPKKMSYQTMWREVPKQNIVKMYYHVGITFVQHFLGVGWGIQFLFNKWKRKLSLTNLKPLICLGVVLKWHHTILVNFWPCTLHCLGFYY